MQAGGRRRSSPHPATRSTAASCPPSEVVDGGLILLAGALLITPGFLTDCLGILLLLPPTRAIARGSCSAVLARPPSLDRRARGRRARAARGDSERRRASEPPAPSRPESGDGDRRRRRRDEAPAPPKPLVTGVAVGPVAAGAADPRPQPGRDDRAGHEHLPRRHRRGRRHRSRSRRRRPPRRDRRLRRRPHPLDRLHPHPSRPPPADGAPGRERPAPRCSPSTPATVSASTASSATATSSRRPSSGCAPCTRPATRRTTSATCVEEERLLFSGDHVMHGSTVVIAPPDGDMAAYLASLERLRTMRPALRAIAPGHGHLIEDPAAAAHRVRRPPPRPRAPGARRRSTTSAARPRPAELVERDLRRPRRRARAPGPPVRARPPAQAGAEE